MIDEIAAARELAETSLTLLAEKEQEIERLKRLEIRLAAQEELTETSLAILSEKEQRIEQLEARLRRMDKFFDNVRELVERVDV
jgi:uncharacterized coiled-coil protein SlyX